MGKNFLLSSTYQEEGLTQVVIKKKKKKDSAKYKCILALSLLATNELHTIARQ